MNELQHLKPEFGERELEAARRVLASAYVGRGPETAAFEAEIGAYLGLGPEHVLAVASGTAALELALAALDWGGKRVAVPAYTCASVHHAVRRAGGDPVAIDTVSDVHADMDIAAANASGADVAVVAHMFGIPQPLDAVAIPFVEDCAQALGARVSGRPVGLQGAAGIFSFGASKLLTAGGIGGALVSKERELIERARTLIAYDRAGDGPRANLEIGDLQSAIGRVQLERLPEFAARREAIFATYVAAGLPMMTARSRDCRPVRLRAVVVSDAAEAIEAALARENIRSRPALLERESGPLPSGSRAATLAKRALFLPIFPAMSDEDAARVARIAASVLLA